VDELNCIVAPDKTCNLRPLVLIKSINGIRDANLEIALLG
jgi:hypothetical protein